MENLFNDLVDGINDVRDHIKGTKKLRYSLEEITSPKHTKKVRSQKGYSQNQLAMIIGASPRSVEAWETGYRKPSTSTEA